MSKDKKLSQTDLDWKNRVLCSDEACIGTIGPDGCCRECGKPYEGELPESFDPASAGAEADDLKDFGDTTVSDFQEDDENAVIEQEAASDDADDEWARRKLCSDEACIGTIGPDGLCKECGKPYAG
jgi:hypothetical protein